jgi:hypothetical protein
MAEHTYVTLSRCRSFEGITLLAPLELREDRGGQLMLGPEAVRRVRPLVLQKDLITVDLFTRELFPPATPPNTEVDPPRRLPR